MHFATLAVTLGALSTTLFDFAKAGPTPSQELIDFNPKWETWVCYPVYDGIFVTACDCKLYNEWSPSTRKLVHNRPWPLSDGCTVRKDHLPEWIGGKTDCCADQCTNWCGNTCIIKSEETCQSGWPVSKANARNNLVNFLGDNQSVKRSDLCPTGHETCYVGGASQSESSNYECVDTRSDIENCGGCSLQDPLTRRSLGDLANASTRDCTLIPNAAVVGCSVGKCTVSKCDPGFVVVSGPNGDVCQRSEQEAIKYQKYRL